MATRNAIAVSERRLKIERMIKSDQREIDLSQFVEEAPEHPEMKALTKLPKEDSKTLLKAGIDPTEKERAGSFLQMNHSVVYCKASLEGVEVLPISAALKMYNLKDYWWKTISPDKDIYTKRADVHQEQGYFIRSFPEAKVIYPLQSCLYITIDKLAQDVHNVIIAKEGSELHVITGCATSPHVRSGLHVGVSEFYVKKGATLIFTMIHNWPEEMVVRPRTGIFVEAGATFVSNYICFMPAKDLQTYPTATLKGKGATATFNTVLLANPGSLMDVGSRVILKAEGCRAEIISRNISTGGKIIARGHLVGEIPGVKGHLECKGLLLSSDSVIHAIPELEGKVAGVEMSHEAAVGKIAREEIEYLMARGLSEEEATSLIIKGFLSLEIKGLPSALKEELDRMLTETGRKAM